MIPYDELSKYMIVQMFLIAYLPIYFQIQDGRHAELLKLFWYIYICQSSQNGSIWWIIKIHDSKRCFELHLQLLSWQFKMAAMWKETNYNVMLLFYKL